MISVISMTSAAPQDKEDGLNHVLWLWGECVGDAGKPGEN